MNVWSWIILVGGGLTALFVGLGWLGMRFSGQIIRSEVNRKRQIERRMGCRNCGWHEGDPLTPRKAA